MFRTKRERFDLVVSCCILLFQGGAGGLFLWLFSLPSEGDETP